MTFLVPSALLGVLLLAIPIVVHLFKPRKMRQTPFSSLRWLKQTHQRLSRRIEWHQWLLFLMRAACILLLVLALAKPLIGFMSSAVPTDRIVILDTSRSMASKVGDSATPMERATELVSGIAQSAGRGDRTALLLAESQPRLAAPLSADASAAQAAAQTAKPTLADNVLTSHLPLIRSLLSEGREAELVFITDNLRGRWQQGEVQAFLKDLPRPPRVKVIDVSGGNAHNAWIAEARLLSFSDDERWIRVDVGSVIESNVPRSVRLTGITGMTDQTENVTLKPGQVVHVGFKLPAGVSLQGQVAQLRLEPADVLASDDIYYLNLDTSLSLRVLLVEPETPGEDGRPVGLYLRAALESLTESKNHALALTRRTSAAVNAADFAKADVIFLAGIPDLTDAALEGLESRVRAGAGLVLFLGPRARTEFYNHKLHRPQQPGEGLFPFTLQSAVSGQPGRLTNVRWPHSLLASLNDPAVDFATTGFPIFGSLEGTLSKRDTVLARFDDDMPAIVERPIGAGRVVLFNTSANTEWGDLPRRKSFVPLMDRLLSYLATGGLKRSFTAGDRVALPIESSEAVVTSPSGGSVASRIVSAGGRTMLYLDELAEPGAYRVTTPGKPDLLFVVNAARTDSPLAAMDSAALEAWWTPATVEILTADSARQQLSAGTTWPLWPALVMLAGLLLLAETVYVHRLCPRANPKAAEAVVPERGILKPVG